MKLSTEPTFNVLDPLLRRWWSILLCAAIGAGIAAARALTAPDWYRAKISVVPLHPTQEGAQASRLPVGLDALAADMQRIQAVLSSSSVADEVIDRFKLEQRYGVPDRDAARAALWSHCSPTIDRRSGLVSLSCEDQDPRVAKDMADFFGEVGNRVFGRVSVSSAREERKFLETQVEKTRLDVADASRKLREFERANKVIDLDEQSKAVVSAMAAIKGEILSKQLELSYQATFAAESEAGVTQLRHQIRILGGKLRELEGKSRKPPSDFFPAASSVPDLRFELEELVREQKTQETLFFSLTQRYETAKVDEARDTSTFQILDHATVPGNASRPKRMRMVELGGFAGAVLACMCIVVAAWWRQRSATTSLE